MFPLVWSRGFGKCARMYGLCILYSEAMAMLVSVRTPYSPIAGGLRLAAIAAIADKKKKLATALQNSVSGVA